MQNLVKPCIIPSGVYWKLLELNTKFVCWYFFSASLPVLCWVIFAATLFVLLFSFNTQAQTTVEERNGYRLIYNETHTKKYGELNGLFKRNNIQQDIKALQEKLTNNKIQIDNEDERIKILEAVENLRIKVEQMYADILLYKKVGAVGKSSSSMSGHSSSSRSGHSSSSRSGPSASTLGTLASVFMGGGHHNTQKGRKGGISQRGRTQKRNKHT